MATERYENTEGGHSKFWELVPTKGGFNAFYGKIDGTPQGPKFYTKEESEKVVAQKLKKGYVKV
jgi:hypothetical protein